MIVIELSGWELVGIWAVWAVVSPFAEGFFGAMWGGIRKRWGLEPKGSE